MCSRLKGKLHLIWCLLIKWTLKQKSFSKHTLQNQLCVPRELQGLGARNVFYLLRVGCEFAPWMLDEAELQNCSDSHRSWNHPLNSSCVSGFLRSEIWHSEHESWGPVVNLSMEIIEENKGAEIFMRGKWLWTSASCWEGEGGVCSETGAQLDFLWERPRKLKSGFNLISALLLGKSKYMLPFAQSWAQTACQCRALGKYSGSRLTSSKREVRCFTGLLASTLTGSTPHPKAINREGTLQDNLLVLCLI